MSNSNIILSDHFLDSFASYSNEECTFYSKLIEVYMIEWWFVGLKFEDSQEEIKFNEKTNKIKNSIKAKFHIYDKKINL